MRWLSYHGAVDTDSPSRPSPNRFQSLAEICAERGFVQTLRLLLPRDAGMDMMILHGAAEPAIPEIFRGSLKWKLEIYSSATRLDRPDGRTVWQWNQSRHHPRICTSVDMNDYLVKENSKSDYTKSDGTKVVLCLKSCFVCLLAFIQVVKTWVFTRQP